MSHGSAEGDSIAGERLSCQAREIRGQGLARTGAHRLQRVALRGSAFCVIDRAAVPPGARPL